MKRLYQPLASRVVSYRLRLLGSAHSRFGSFASQKRYSIVFARSPLPDTRQGSNLDFGDKTKKTPEGVFLYCEGAIKKIFSPFFVWV